MVDQNGVPVLVEVKRSSDTRIRREVIAQMLDYASRISLLDTAMLRSSFIAHNPDVEDYYQSDGFWDLVSDNLKNEQIKLVFVADRIPDSLRILIEFMDRSMKSIEVYGVEVRQYKTAEETLLATNTIANPLVEMGKSRAASGPRIDWDYNSFVEHLERNGLSNCVEPFEQLIRYANDIRHPFQFGHGPKYPTAHIVVGKNVLGISSYVRKEKMICLADLPIPRWLKLLNSPKWTDASIRQHLTAWMPEEAKEDPELFWETETYLNFHMELFARYADYMPAFLKALTELFEELESSLPTEAKP